MVPTQCLTAAEAPYAAGSTLRQLADAALVNYGCYVQNGGVMTPPASRNDWRQPAKLLPRQAVLQRGFLGD